MKRIIETGLGLILAILLLGMLPVVAHAETEPAKSNPPPVSQPLVTEGIFAVKLTAALGVMQTTDEVAAETGLGEKGISPRNGWIADYPVTPDIIGEVRQSLATAADNKQLALDRDEALKRFGETVGSLDLAVRVYTSGESSLNRPISCENYPNPATVADAYSGEEPPIVSYYCPPADYYDLYSWVPYPFWWSDFWFPGFFILRDFHRHVSFHKHFVLFSNHFIDRRRNHFFRIDPVDRFHGRTFAGIGVRTSHEFRSTGIPRSPTAIFNAPRGTTSSSGSGMRGSGSGGMRSGSFSGGMRGGGSGMFGGGGGGRR
jgi:uncharacterized membrane protein YgcG